MGKTRAPAEIVRRFLSTGELPDKTDVSWGLLIALSSQRQTWPSLVHHCEKMLLQDLTSDNYVEFLRQSLFFGSWELKVALIYYFALHARSILATDNSVAVQELMPAVLEGFLEDRSHLGLLESSSEE